MEREPVGVWIFGLCVAAMPALPTRALVLPSCTKVKRFPNRFAFGTFGKEKTTFK
jgi:hypothetical protein